MNQTLTYEEWLANVESVTAKQRMQLAQLRARLEQITARFAADRQRVLLTAAAPPSATRQDSPNAFAARDGVALPDVPRMV